MMKGERRLKEMLGNLREVTPQTVIIRHPPYTITFQEGRVIIASDDKNTTTRTAHWWLTSDVPRVPESLIRLLQKQIAETTRKAKEHQLEAITAISPRYSLDILEGKGVEMALGELLHDIFERFQKLLPTSIRSVETLSGHWRITALGHTAFVMYTYDKERWRIEQYPNHLTNVIALASLGEFVRWAAHFLHAMQTLAKI